ncbi:hypothetical protein HPB52_013288 [Rhipicephalus sanguineus]|uniref:Uncharacterized protein n=1 Tax=Rhipicephalus sanguineus TaxID=34632 RepID=A0A9D4Q6Q7_RHISA|nr:hypothetical protein HPB52_013288 [Rhipicephalus sanguineus]
MAFEKTHFSGSRLNYRTPCTSREGHLCNIFGDIHLWNEFFWPAGFQLKELSPGRLSLVKVRDVYDPLVKRVWKDASTLLHHLLTHHRCVSSVDLDIDLMEDHHELICDALCKSPNLRKLKLRLRRYATSEAHSFAATLPHLNQLRDLELSHVDLDRLSLETLSNFLANTRSLTTLIMTDLNIESEDAVVVVQGLKRNATITTLSVNRSLVSLESSQCGMTFSNYIRWNKTLRTLSVTSRSLKSFTDLRPIIGALSYNNTLFELNLIGLLLDMQNKQLITDMLIQNRTLRSFRMVDSLGAGCPFHRHSNVKPEVRAVGNESCLLSLWLVALTENKTLKELHLNLSRIIEPADYSSLFKALARNTSLQKVTLQTMRKDDMTQICRALQDTGVPERFFVIEPHELDTVAELPGCNELTSTSVACCSPLESGPLHSAVYLLPTCSHVKLLRLRMAAETLNSNLSSFIAQYIANTTTLRELDLIFDHRPWPLHTLNQETECPQRTLVKALSNNKTIRRLSIEGLYFDHTETQMLVGMVHSSRTLCQLSLFPCSHISATELLQKLSQNISSNYTLLDINVYRCWENCSDLFAVEEVARRNSSLVTRAADFVMGTKFKYCAVAAELLQCSPGLVAKVQELALIDENEAALRVKKSLKSFSDLDDFMRLAGVVKCSVTCHRLDDGKKQLVDLNRDCWLHIRQYIKLGDIQDCI